MNDIIIHLNTGLFECFPKAQRLYPVEKGHVIVVITQDGESKRFYEDQIKNIEVIKSEQ